MSYHRAAKKSLSQKTQSLLRLAEFGKLSSGLFHDLMNPITSLLLEIDILKDTNHCTKKSYLSIQNSCKVLQEHIYNVRKVLSSEAVQSLFNIRKEIDSAIYLLKYKIYQKNIYIRTDIVDDLHYKGNNFAFYRVILNLISNAIDSYDSNIQSKKRSVLIKCREGAKYIYISIQDTGCGIPKNKLPHVFKPFITSKNSCGLGLSICKDILEKDFKGKIRVKSVLAKGTTFYIQLPNQ